MVTGSPVVRTPCFHCQGPRFDPWSGNQDPANHMACPKQKEKQKLFIQKSMKGKGPWPIMALPRYLLTFKENKYTWIKKKVELYRKYY